MGHGPDSSQGKSPTVTSLAIASASSAAAAVVVNALRAPGTIIGAALTPVLMTLFAEALRRPAQRVTVRGGDVNDATITVQRRSRRWRQAKLTGLAAFALGSIGLTAAELLLNGALGDRNARTTLLDGGAGRSPSATPSARSPTATPPPPVGGAAESERLERSSPAPTPLPTPTVGAPTRPSPTPAQPRSEPPDQVEQK
jgi:hypothetical protein